MRPPCQYPDAPGAATRRDRGACCAAAQLYAAVNGPAHARGCNSCSSGICCSDECSGAPATVAPDTCPTCRMSPGGGRGYDASGRYICPLPSVRSGRHPRFARPGATPAAARMHPAPRQSRRSSGYQHAGQAASWPLAPVARSMTACRCSRLWWARREAPACGSWSSAPPTSTPSSTVSRDM